MDDEMQSVTCTAPVNIAVIKYWGKRDEELVLPVNSSLSITLSQEELRTVTTVCASRQFEKDRIWVNGREESMENPRLKRLLAKVRQRAREEKMSDDVVLTAHDYHVHICSENNFPTAAGLASSAAGYACLAFALSQLFNIQSYDISTLARLGSGSACRSVYSGFVKWEMGEKEDGADSIAVQVCPASHWPQLEVLILVVSSDKKAVSSTRGMQTSIQTSPLMKYRCETVVPQRMTDMERAIKERDFESFARLTMQDSNQFHAVCLDSYPPILYLNDTSKKLIQLVTQYNQLYGGEKVAYTFDAGPNAVLFCLTDTIPELISMVTHYFPPLPENSRGYVRGKSAQILINPLNQRITSRLNFDPTPGLLQYIIHTGVGEGPRLVQRSSLLGRDGLPLVTTPSN